MAGAKMVFSYARDDEEWRVKLESHLKQLEREGLIEPWHDGHIHAGAEWEQQIDARFHEADIILALLSSSFLRSEYIWNNEMKTAEERHGAKSAIVVPVLVRPCDWQTSWLGKLQATPKNAKAITTWNNEDEAFLSVVQYIRKLVEVVRGSRLSARISGRVRDEKGMPVVGATVRVAGQEATSEVDGGFEMIISEERVDREMQLHATAEGYTPARCTCVPGGNGVVVVMRREA